MHTDKRMHIECIGLHHEVLLAWLHKPDPDVQVLRILDMFTKCKLGIILQTAEQQPAPVFAVVRLLRPLKPSPFSRVHELRVVFALLSEFAVI